MKILLLTFLFLQLSLGSFSQTTKLYVNDKNKVVVDPKKANAYVLIEKLDYSAYSVSKYDLSNNIIFRGTFKDSKMQIPNGKFLFFYTKDDYGQIIKKTQTNISTTLHYTGYFLNGLKTSRWIEYVNTGTKRCLYNYENNKLNGFYQEFDIYKGNVAEEGNLIENEREGEWNIYENGNAKPVTTTTYLHNQAIKVIYHTLAAKSAPGLDKYIDSALNKYLDFFKSESIVVNLALNENGKVDSVAGVNKSLNQHILTAVKTVFLKAPDFEPGLQDDQPVKQIYYYSFRFRAVKPTENENVDAAPVGSPLPIAAPNSIDSDLRGIGFGLPLS